MLRETNKTMARKRGLIMETPTCQVKRKKEEVSMSVLIYHLVVGNTLEEVMIGMIEPSSRLT